MLARFQADLLVQKLNVKGFVDCGCSVVVEHDGEDFPVVVGDGDDLEQLGVWVVVDRQACAGERMEKRRRVWGVLWRIGLVL